MKLNLSRAELLKMWSNVEPWLAPVMTVMGMPDEAADRLRMLIGDATQLTVKTRSGLTLEVTFND